MADITNYSKLIEAAITNFDEIYTNQPIDIDFHHDDKAYELLEKSKEQFEDLVY